MAPVSRKPLLRRAVVAVSGQLLADMSRRVLTTERYAEVVDCVRTLEDTRQRLQQTPADLLVATPRLSEGDALDLLREAMAQSWCKRLLVVTDGDEPHVTNILRNLGAHGVLDSQVDGTVEFQEAVRRVCVGRGYWSSTLGSPRGGRVHPRVQRVFMLSPTERFLFSVLGAGCDDRTAADQLGLSASAVHEYRKRLHQKLDVRHRGQLVTLAIQAGFVRITSQGIECPGQRALRSQCQFRTRRVA